MDTLNEQQKRAATFSGKHLLVLAGAGTGKTRTIIARAKHLIKSGVEPRRILILSFTRKAANEIVERISAELAGTNASGLAGSTFHSWCMSIIKNHPNVFPQSRFTLLDEEDQESCFRLLCGKKWSYKNARDRKVSPEEILAVYSYMANALCTLSDAIRMKLYDNAPATLNVEADVTTLRGVITMYLEYKRSRNYIDYDDILMIVSKYLKRNEELRHHIAGLYDHILIDEMQDTNPLQYELLSSFYDDCHLFCVGDDAQSIYGFRGADFHTIHNFPKIVSGAETQKLTLNYRSTQEILDLSNWLIANSPLNYGKELKAARGHGDKPLFLHWADEWEEANNIAETILDAYRQRGRKWSDNLVLSRSAWGLRRIEGCLVKHKIPYKVFGGNSLMASRHIRDIVAPIRIVSNYLDELAWSRYLQLWNNLGPVKAAQIIGEVMQAHNLDDSLQTLMESVTRRSLEPEIYEALVEISSHRHDPSAAIEGALRIMKRRLEHIYRNDGWEWRKDDFPILVDVAKKTGSLTEFIAEYILDPKLETTVKEEGKIEDCVTLSTIHSAKGLEASAVYLVGASAKAYPTPRAVLNGEEAVEEERRCLYVALTRAKDELRVYRDIHSIHVYSDQEKHYFFHGLPASLYDNRVIAAHYFASDRFDLSSPIDEDIYSDFNLE